jgi:predicted acyltransferase
MSQTLPPKRLLSVDTLRGFDMLLIAGGGTFIERLKGKTGLSWVDAIAGQLTHPAWHGFTFYDFIFPLFLFIAGVSLVFSLESGLQKNMSRETLVKKVFKRMIILFLLGIIDKNIPTDVFHPSNIRFGTVLSRIGIATFFGALFYLYLTPRQRFTGVVTILLLYYAALFLIPVPGYGAGDISFEGNLVGWFDRTFMPGRLLQKTYDENALLTQFPAMCLTILGTFAGSKLRETTSDGTAKVIWLRGSFYPHRTGMGNAFSYQQAPLVKFFHPADCRYGIHIPCRVLLRNRNTAVAPLDFLFRGYRPQFDSDLSPVQIYRF